MNTTPFTPIARAAQFALRPLPLALLLALGACGGGGGADTPAEPGAGTPTAPVPTPVPTPAPAPAPAPATAPVITSQPSGANVTAGQSVNLAVAASGSGPLAYQWLRQGVPVAGATSASLSFVASLADNGVAYSVQVSNPGGSVISALALLAVIPPLPAPAMAATSTTLSASFYHSLAVKTDGTVWAWGWNDYGQLGDGTQTDRALPREPGAGALAQRRGRSRYG
jgi:Regulator of chromosome condensation (RCC1) repeat